MKASIDAQNRKSIMRAHSSCHLLQAALRTVLGNHVEQAGSFVDADHCRFDFTHFAPLTKDELRDVESQPNSPTRQKKIDRLERELDTEYASLEDYKGRIQIYESELY